MKKPDDCFWKSRDTRVMGNPFRPNDAEGLTNFAETRDLTGLVFFQTSGSEGLPKWVGLAKEAFLISGAAVNEHFRVTAADRWLLALPMHHVGGFSIQARAHLSHSEVVGGGDSKWDATEFAAQCGRHGITLASLVPAQVYDLVRARLHCPPTVRAVIVGGGSFSPALAEQARALGWPVFATYGMTEAASQIATQPLGSSDVESLRVLPHWRLDLNDEGLLIVRGVALAKGYAIRGADGAWQWEPIDPDRGLRTRDRARLSISGGRTYLKFLGRESGCVKILGELVHLPPLQAKLEGLALQDGVETPWNSMPVIVPVPDARREARLVLAVEAADERRGTELLRRFNAEVAGLCQISAVTALARIPRTPVGKVDFAGVARAVAELTP